jgi:hypothetical protein
MADVLVKDLGLDRLVRNVSSIEGRGVSFGIQAGDDTEEGTDVLDIAIFNEFGTDTIPPRPFMRDFADKNMAVLQQAMERILGRVEAGAPVDQALGQLGQFAADAQRAHVRASPEWAEPNAAATVKAKKSAVPLIDDAVMVNAIRDEVL